MATAMKVEVDRTARETTTMTDVRRKAGRLLTMLVGAGLLAVATAACASSSADELATSVPAVTTTPIAAAIVDATVPVPDPSTPATSPVETTVAAPVPSPIDGAALLASAISGLSNTYHFTTVIAVDNAVVLSADGDHVGDSVRLALTASAGVVNYIITPDGSWVMPAGGEWEQLDSAAATSDPITALAAPSTVTVSASDETSATLAVTVPAGALGLAAAAPDVAMTCDLVDGQLHGVHFESVIDGKPAVVTAEFGPVVDGSPVVAPI
jgi:hypothetical protein